MIDDTKFIRNLRVTLSRFRSESNEKNKNEHPAGVAPPCRPPPAGCSEFPSHAVHDSTAPTGLMEGGHVT